MIPPPEEPEVARRTIKVGVLVPFHTVTGPGRQLAAVAQALRDRNVELRVAVFRRRSGPAEFAQLLQEHGVPVTIVPDRGPLDLRLLRDVHQTLSAWRPHIVQTHGYKAAAAAYDVSRRLRLPWIGFFHGVTHERLRARFYHRIEQFLLRSADRVVVMAETQRALFAGAADRVRLLENAVITSSNGGEPPAAVRSAVLSLERPVLGVVGRLSPEKGVDVFLRACAELERGGKHVSAVIVGDGPARRALEKLSRELGLDRAVRFLGHVNEVAWLYRRLDALVIPSRSEGLPNVLLEALAADLPVAATSVGGVPAVLSGCAGCCLVTPDDPAALAEAVGEVLARGQTSAAVAARRHVTERYSLDRRVQQHIELYSELLRGPAELPGEVPQCAE